jgi:hypothetical protein
VERAVPRSDRPGRHACAIDANRQTHQRRISHRGLDPAGQHHDAGAGPGDGACAGSISSGDPTIAVTAPDFDARPRARVGQEATRVESCAHTGAGSAGAVGAGSRSGVRSRGGE